MVDNRKLKSELYELAEKYDKLDVETATSLRRAADELDVTSKAVAPSRSSILEGMSNMIRQQPNGEYYISDILLIDLSSENVQLLNWLLRQLVDKFPEYVWGQTTSLDPYKRGVLITWRLKYKYIQKEKNDESGPNGL